MTWLPPLLVSAYLLGFTVTCRKVACSDMVDLEHDGMVTPIFFGLFWPVFAGAGIFVGFLWLIGGGVKSQ